MRALLGAMIVAGLSASVAADPPAAPQAPPASAKAADVAAEETIGTAADLIKSKHAAEALPLLDAAIALQDAAHASEKRQIFCASSPEETLMYALMGATGKKDTVVLGPEWATLIFMKGFALIDLGRGGEAKAYLERALALSPEHPHYLSELAEWYKARKDWAHAYDLFQRASDNAVIAPKTDFDIEKGRALRGMGYVLTEQNKLDEAEKRYRECLKLNPHDEAAKGELEYIRGLKSKVPAT
jgi:tetratricopeptide (TPR) repeat protein